MRWILTIAFIASLAAIGLLAQQPVTIYSGGSAVPVSTTTEVTEDAAATQSAVSLYTMTVRTDTPTSSAGTDGDNAYALTNAKGALWVSQIDPCSAETKITKEISQTASSVVFTSTASKLNYICALTLAPTTTAEIVSIEEGTGSTCGTNTAVLMGSSTAANGLSIAANTPWAFGNGAATVIAGRTAARDLCLIQSGANRVSGLITYVQATAR